MRRRNLILITVLSLSLTFAAGCGENKNTGAAGSMDQQKTSETTVQNETGARNLTGFGGFRTGRNRSRCHNRGRAGRTV